MPQRLVRLAMLSLLSATFGCGGTNPPRDVGLTKTADEAGITISADEDPWQILAKAVAAMGGSEKLKRWSVGKIEYKEWTEIAAKNTPLVAETTFEDTFQLPGYFKRVMHMRLKTGQEITNIRVGSNGTGWVRKPTGEIAESEDKYSGRMRHPFAEMLDPTFERADAQLKVLGEGQVEGQVVVIVRVQSSEANGDCYFAKSSALLVKHTKVMHHPFTGKEVTAETYLSEYKTIQGGKVPMRIRTFTGPDPFCDITILDLQFSDKIDKSEFAKP